MKPLAYTKPLLMLPFDHRSSFSKDLLGFSGTLTPAQHAQVEDMKRVVYEGFIKSAGAPKDWYSILADDEYAINILYDAKKRGYSVAMPVEKSGQQEFSFDHDNWQARIQAINPSIVKVLVRYNPKGDKKLNTRQLAKLRQLSSFCKKSNIPLLFELLVPSTDEQTKKYAGKYDTQLRPKLVAQAIKEIKEKVHVSIWKLEGLSKEQWKPVIAAANSTARKDAPVFIVLGRNAKPPVVDKWLRAAAAHKQVTGFAVGRTIFYEPLAALRDKNITRAQAVERIANEFTHFAHVWTKAKKLS